MVRASLKLWKQECTGAFAVPHDAYIANQSLNKVRGLGLIPTLASATRKPPHEAAPTKAGLQSHPHCLHANAADAAPTLQLALFSFRHDHADTHSSSPLQTQPH